MNENYAITGAKIAAKILNIPDEVIEVVFKEKKYFKDSEIIGAFIKNGFWIVFNKDLINSSLPEEIFVTAFHETRHAYQALICEFGNQLPFFIDEPNDRIKRM